MTRISVILCCYNGAGSVERALQSVFRQTLASNDYEVVFVNDGSTDATEDAVAPYRTRDNMHYVAHETNRGLVASCNRGLEEVRGDYLIRLDADDTFEPDILERLLPLLQHGETDLVYCDRYEWAVDRLERHTVTLETFNLFDLIASGTMMRRDLVRALGGYRELFWEEYDLYLRYLLKSGRPPVRVPEPLYTYTRRRGSMTDDERAVREGWEELLRLWPRHLLEQFGRVPDLAAQLMRQP